MFQPCVSTLQEALLTFKGRLLNQYWTLQITLSNQFPPQCIALHPRIESWTTTPTNKNFFTQFVFKQRCLGFQDGIIKHSGGSACKSQCHADPLIWICCSTKHSTQCTRVTSLLHEL